MPGIERVKGAVQGRHAKHSALIVEARREAGDETERLGLITERQARQSERFKNSLGRLEQAATGVGTSITSLLIPKIQPLIDGLTRFLVDERPFHIVRVDEALTEFDEVVSSSRDRIEGLARRLQSWYRTLAAAALWIDGVVKAVQGWIEETGLRIALGLATAVIARGFLFAIVALFRPIAQLGRAVGVGEAVRQRKRAGRPVEPDLLAHISPLGWGHILLTGEYRWPKRR